MNFKEILAKHAARKAMEQNGQAQPTTQAKAQEISPSAKSALAKLLESRNAKDLVQAESSDTESDESGRFSEDEDEPESTESVTTTDKHGNLITYNSKQQEFIDLVLTGQSCILIGAAGTGKTTCMKGVMSALISSGAVLPMGNHNHKYLPSNCQGTSVSAYTRRATNNIRKNLSLDMQGNALTIHKLLEYQPFYTEIEDENTGKIRTTMSFEPARNANNPLPSSLAVCILEEASMISVELFKEIEDAMAHGVQYIFLGDIQQLPPVFGSAILGYKMLELPVIELTEVYRQALESPIIRLAHRILSGKPIPESEFASWHVPKQMTLHAWKKRISADSATLTLAKFFLQNLDNGGYNPSSDAILIPFNKSCGTDDLNKHIASAIAIKETKLVWEIIHGFKKSYYSLGDKCLYDREDAIITNIYPNSQYTGAIPQSESASLNYWGHKKSDKPKPEGDQDIDFLLRQVSAGDSGDDDKVRAASHCVELTLLDSDRTVTIKTAGELNALILGYAITVHKSQGSEWEKVFLCLHNSHNTMLSRELLYTAVTRPKKELFVICEPDHFEKGIMNQRIKGNTLAEKAEYFKGKLERGELQS